MINYQLSQKKLTKKNGLPGNFTPLINKSFQTSDHFFPLLFPKDSESHIFLVHPTSGSGAKRRLNGTSKVNTRTDIQTHTRTDISTYSL